MFAELIETLSCIGSGTRCHLLLVSIFCRNLFARAAGCRMYSNPSFHCRLPALHVCRHAARFSLTGKRQLGKLKMRDARIMLPRQDWLVSPEPQARLFRVSREGGRWEGLWRWRERAGNCGRGIPLEKPTDGGKRELVSRRGGRIGEGVPG